MNGIVNRTTQGRLDRGTNLPTRELKLHLAILKAWLRCFEVRARGVRRPAQTAQARMRQRLGLYEMELAVRDARREWAQRQAARTQMSRLGTRVRAMPAA